jgi:hypothetical protein
MRLSQLHMPSDAMHFKGYQARLPLVTKPGLVTLDHEALPRVRNVKNAEHELRLVSRT